MNWLINAAEIAGGRAAERPKIGPATPRDEAYALVARAYGITEAALAASVAALFRLQPAALELAEPHAARLLPERLARRHGVLPLRETHDEIVVATSDPTDHDAERAVEFATCRRVVLQIAEPRALAAAIEASYAPERAIEALLHTLAPHASSDTGATPAGATAAARMMELVLDAAVAAHAGAIVLEPGRHQGIVRLCVDGAWRSWARMPLGALARVVAHVKTLAHLDVADRLHPRTAVARVRVGAREHELDVATTPVRDAERVLLRMRDGGVSSGCLAEGGSGDRTGAEPRILLAASDAATRDLAAAVLASSGYDVVPVESNDAALESLAAGADFALAILDLDVPRASAIAVLHRLHATATAGLPVLALTGTASEDAEAALMQEGADDYVRTPLDPTRFVARVRAVLRRAAS